MTIEKFIINEGFRKMRGRRTSGRCVCVWGGSVLQYTRESLEISIDFQF